MEEQSVEKKKICKEDKLKELLSENAKPFVKKQDGIARKIEEDTNIEYEDYEGNKLTMTIPAGSYIVGEGSGDFPEVREAEDFEAKNQFVSEESKPETTKKSSGPKIGLESMTE